MEDDLVTWLKCDVELSLNDPDEQEVNRAAAEALRKVADLLEAGQYEDGFYDVKNSKGKKLGTVYTDYSEGSGLGTAH